MGSPSLLIRRVVVEGELSCDLRFERGLDIVWAVEEDGDPRSTNRCGKTSLVELIRYGLGRQVDDRQEYHFASIMDRLGTLYLEIEANGQVITVGRSLQQTAARAQVHEGPYVRGMADVPGERVDIQDLSHLLLNALAIPAVSVRERSGQLEPLSFSLLTRAFVLHQEDSLLTILQKVPKQRRADILGFLSGITPVGRFSIEEKLGSAIREVQKLQGDYASVQSFLSRNGVPTLLEATARVDALEASLVEALEAQQSIQCQIQGATRQQAQPSGRIDDLRRDFLAASEEAARIERAVVGLQQQEERLGQLLASLRVDREKSQRVQASSTVLSTVEFGICPRCLQGITPEMRQREQYARCQLCNRPLTRTSDMPPRATPRVQDIELQIAETQAVLTDVVREREAEQARLDQCRAKQCDIGRVLDMESEAYVSPAVDRLLARSHELAVKEAELAQARTLLSQAQALDAMKVRLDTLKQDVAELEDRLSEARRPVMARLEKLRQTYEAVLRAVDFPDIRTVSIESQSLMPLINGHLYTHAGTAYKALAVVCFHLALLELAMKEETFFPRMLVVDSPAIGDLNEESHDKLLRYLATLQAPAEEIDLEDSVGRPDWQIILTTRRMISDLEPFVVERISSPDHMLLRSGRRGPMAPHAHPAP